MKVIILASGSGGNAALFESYGTRVLVDAGIGPLTLRRRLEQIGDAAPPDALVLTHAHGDHVEHAAVLARRLGIPVYLSESTARVLRLDVERRRVFGAREPFAIGALTISPLPLPHDAAQVALVISDGVHRVGLATESRGSASGLAGTLAPCDVVLIESNHDVEMLAHGPYLPHLKRRVLSSRGHLSNAQTHELLRKLPESIHTVVLMHLSLINNRRDLALEVARDALAFRRVRLHAASSTEPLLIDAARPAPSEPLRARNAKPVQLSLFDGARV